MNLVFAITFDELRDIQKQCVAYELSKNITNKLIILTTSFECDYDPLPLKPIDFSNGPIGIKVTDLYTTRIRYIMDIKGDSGNSKLDFICFQHLNKFNGVINGYFTYNFPLMLDNGALYITFVEEYTSVDELRKLSCYDEEKIKYFEEIMESRKFYNATSTLYMTIDVPIEVKIPERYCYFCNKTHKWKGKRKSEHNFFINNEELSDFLFLMKRYDVNYSQEQYEGVLKEFGLKGKTKVETEFGKLIEKFIIEPPKETTRVYKIRSKKK